MNFLNFSIKKSNFVFAKCFLFLLTILFTLSTGLSPLMAQPIQQLGNSGNQAGPTSVMATVALSNVVVTAVRAGNAGGLKLISWSRPNSGPVRRLGDSGTQTGKIGDFMAMVKVGNNKVATLIETVGPYYKKKKKIILWLIQSDGKITRLSDSGDQLGVGLSTSLDIYFMKGSRKLITAVNIMTSRVILTSWGISATGKLVKLQNYVHERGFTPRLMSINHSSFGDALVLAYKNNNKLALSTFRVASNGAFTLIHETSAGDIQSGFAIASYKNKLAIGLKAAGTQHFKLIVWAMNSSGRLSRKGAAQAGIIKGIPSIKVTRSVGNDFIVSSAVITNDYKVKLINWKVETGGASITRLSSSTTVGVNVLDVDLVGSSPITTVIRNTQRVKLYNWRY